MTVHVTIVTRSRCSSLSVFATRPQGEELRLLPLIIMLLMVPIDLSRKELSNGCRIVILVKFDLISEIPAVGGDFPLPAAF